jgi:hypothetical protein
MVLREHRDLQLRIDVHVSLLLRQQASAVPCEGANGERKAHMRGYMHGWKLTLGKSLLMIRLSKVLLPAPFGPTCRKNHITRVMVVMWWYDEDIRGVRGGY